MTDDLTRAPLIKKEAVTPGPLTLEDLERLERERLADPCGPDCGLDCWGRATDRLLSSLRSVMAERDAAQDVKSVWPSLLATAQRERDEARGQVRSLTVERDAAREEAAWMRSERDKWRDFQPVTADLVDRLSRAREALASWDVCLSNGAGPPVEPTPEAINRASDAVAALRAALAEPSGEAP